MSPAEGGDGAAAASAPMASPAAPWRGMAFMLASTVFAAGMVAIVRHVSLSLHPLEVAFFRVLFGVAVLAPVFVRHGLAPLRTRRLPIHGARALCTTLTITLSFWAIAIAPLAKVMSINFGAPLFATMVAFVALREPFRPRRAVALAVGITGMLVILRPGVADVELGAGLALLAAMAWATEMTVIKILMRTETSLTATLYMGVLAAPLILVLAAFVWRMPSAEELAWLAVLGALGSFSHLSFAEAFKAADMTAVLPLKYTQLVWIAVIGFVAFGEVPDVWTAAGAALIVGGAGYLAVRER